MTAATTMRMGGAGVTTRDHCPTCGHRHQRGPAGRLVCGGDDGTCKCDPADPCRCGVCEMARASRAERKPSAGWVEGDGALPGDIMLHVGRCIAAAGPGGPWVVTMLAKSVDGAPAMTVVAQGKASSRLAAQLAAEDALLAIAAEIVGAVGR